MTREEALQEIKSWDFLEGKEIEAIHTLIPELAESEDERMIRKIESFLSAYGADYFPNGDLREIEVWLEKQKEPKHDATDAKSERVIKAARSVLNNWLDGTDCPDVSGDFAELEYAIREYDGEEKQKEQKPETLTEVAKEYTIREDYTSAYYEQKGYSRGYADGKKDAEQKPVSISCGHENDAEWSEWDADILNCCISSIEEAKENRYAYKETDGDTSYDREIAFLKSLRPVSKESLQPHWKPSEEQMEALKRASTNEYLPAKQFDILVSLYEQLKKL